VLGGILCDSLISNQVSLSACKNLLSASHGVAGAELPSLRVIRWRAGDSENLAANSLGGNRTPNICAFVLQININRGFHAERAMLPNDPKLSHGANNRKRESALKRKMKEQPPLAPARC
jgi:hypothetical protein